MNKLLAILNRIDKFLAKYIFWFYLSSAFLLNVPYYYLIPGRIIFSNTYFLARFLTLFIFIYIFFSSIYRNQRRILTRDKVGRVLILLLVGQSFSIIKAFDIYTFLKTFEHLVFAVLFYFNTIFFIKQKGNKILRSLLIIIILSVVINILDEFFIFINKSAYLRFAEIFLYSSQIEFIKTNLFRGRLFLDKYIEIFVPIFLYLIITVKNRKIIRSLFSILIILFIGFLSLISGWRMRLVTFILTIIGSSFILIKELKRVSNIVLVLISTIIIVMIFYFGSQYMNYYFGYSTFSRLILEDKQDYSTLIGRLKLYQKAIDLFISSPIIGVGQGHYPLIEPSQLKNIYFTKEVVTEQELVGLGPHNIFLRYLAETGLVGTIPFILLIVFFLKKDSSAFFLMKQRLKLNKILILSFWLLFSFALFHPQLGFHFYGLLFGLRAIIHSS